MSMVEWNEEMSVGVPELDGHHKKLIDMINELAVAIRQHRGKKQVEDLIDELVDYTEYHFNLEHEYFDKFGYVEAGQHINEHIKFVNKIRETNVKLKTGKCLLSINVLYYLKDWLVNHIMKSDKQYAELLQSNGIH